MYPFSFSPFHYIPYFFCPSIREGGHGVKEVWRRDGLQAEPGREVKVGKLKSAASKRTVPLNDTAIAMIQDLRKETYFGEDTPLVPGEHGNFTRPVNFRKRYYRILAAAGIEKKGLHSLRHTFATLALQNGVDVKTVSSILGHFSAGFTLDTYAHVTTTAQREAAKKMDGVLGQRVP
ncbi:MAG TPA: site-specific integrase [Candidatus Acutalibacter ornithocaccae]|uniref:Site-specific integrase n=1 Tax=Candidatus Acutalibacter ornithocaccae TaxID=2838416 RepID=A0A9D2LZ35_9FIRM|nr:site-specific integrase [Candidatus Acutalibacter ornithocaccae]